MNIDDLVVVPEVVVPKPYVTTTRGLRGHFALIMCWNPEHGGFWEPWQSSPNSWDSERLAEIEAQSWAKDEGIEYKPRRTPCLES